MKTTKQTKQSIRKVQRLLEKALAELGQINGAINNELNDYHSYGNGLITCVNQAEGAASELLEDDKFWKRLQDEYHI